MRRAMAEATRDAVRARRGSEPGCDGRPVPEENLHVTLAFLGSVPERQLQPLAEVARGAAQSLRSALAGEDAPGSPLELAFDHLEHWRAARLLCALPAAPPAWTVALARSLQALLTANGFTPYLKSSWSVGIDIRPFRPHVTLARKVQRPPSVMAMQPVTWGFTDFVLVDSKTLPEGSVYTVLERFPVGHSSPSCLSRST